MIQMVEAMSGRICEECGQPDQVLVDGSVFLTRCPAHAPEKSITRAEYLARRKTKVVAP